MRRIKIVADSACDLFEQQHPAFASAPMKVITAEKEFVDDETLDVNTFVQFMSKYKGKSKSSCPNEIHPLRGLCSFYAEMGGILVGFEKA